ncbi:MAG: CapA family protein [Elusimicrobiaceae bacterium]|nr:CapA family protein [Elusimicrobiaceae bacterium]
MSIKVLIGADICPTKSNNELFAKADIKALLGEELQSLLHAADYTVFNLETPLTDRLSPIAKCGPCLAAPTVTINGLKAINPHFFTLANNHILDQDAQGLHNTEDVLKQAGIAYAGVGENMAQTARPHIATIKGVKLGIYCCTEHEFSIATDNTPGANPYDPLTSFDAVRELAKQCDFVLVLYHGGKEHYRYPSPQLQRVFRKFAECGAGLVIAQHTHCIGCMEKYQGATLLYGQGNFLFDNSSSEYWLTNLLVELSIDEPTKQFSIRYIPCVKYENGTRLATGEQAQQILVSFNERSAQIQQNGFVFKNYQQFTSTKLNSCLQRCAGKLGNNFLVRIINRLTKYRLFQWVYSQQDLAQMQNLAECESFREVFLQALKGKMK